MVEKQDVSNQALAALLVLTLVVTMVGTWLVVDALGAGPSSIVTSPGGGAQEAEVSLTILPSPASSGVTANVGLEILPS